MASILKVDKIRGTGLDSDTFSLDASGNLTFNKNVTVSSGKTITNSGTASGFGLSSPLGNTVTVTSDGGNVAQNLGDAVHKHYLRHNAGTTVVSFNTSSTTDNGTAHYTGNFTNNMSNTVHIHTSMHEGGTDYFRYTMPITYNTSSHVHKVRLLNQSHFLELDIGTVAYGILGDLA